MGLMHIPNVKIFFEPEEFEVEGMRCLAMPYVHQKEKRALYNTMEGKYDYIFPHLVPKKYSFGGEFADFSVNGTFVHGHMHNTDDYLDDRGNRNIILGVPQTTRNGEQVYEKRAALVGKDVQFEALPRFMEIVDLKFGEFPENPDWLINVVAAPSLQAVGEMYKGFHYRKAGIDVLRSEHTAIELIEGKERVDSLAERFTIWGQRSNQSAEIMKLGKEYLAQV
jgi:hypothetical protein